jgi:cytochrome b561
MFMTKPAQTTTGPANDNWRGYDAFAISLHWLTALLVLAQFGLAELWGLAPHSARHLMIVAHMSLGVLLAWVLIIRIGWRVLAVRPVGAAPASWGDVAAKAVHYALYGLLAAEAVLGFLLRWSGNEAMSFFGLQIPSPIEPFSKSGHHLVGEAHEWVAWTIVILAAFHALAAAFHGFVLRDDVLKRMLPSRDLKARSG